MVLVQVSRHDPVFTFEMQHLEKVLALLALCHLQLFQGQVPLMWSFWSLSEQKSQLCRYVYSVTAAKVIVPLVSVCHWSYLCLQSLLFKTWCLSIDTSTSCGFWIFGTYINIYVFPLLGKNLSARNLSTLFDSVIPVLLALIQVSSCVPRAS